MREKQRTPFYPPYFKARPSSSSSFPSSFSFLDASNQLQVKQVYTLVVSVEVQILSSLSPFSRSRGEELERKRKTERRRHETTSEPVFLSPSLFLSSFFSLSHFLKFVPRGQRSARGNSSKRERERDWQKVRHVSLNGYLSPILDIPILLRACMQ